MSVENGYNCQHCGAFVRYGYDHTCKIHFQTKTEAIAARDNEWVAGGDAVFVNPCSDYPKSCKNYCFSYPCHYYKWQQLKKDMGVS